MPNTLYRYTEALGLVKKSSDDVKDSDKWFEHKDQAMMFYLKEKRESYLDAINMLNESLAANRDLLKEVEKDLEPYKNKYPEEFI